MMRIEPLGTGVVLPAVAIGYEIASTEQDQQIERFDEAPGWIITLDPNNHRSLYRTNDGGATWSPVIP